MNKQSADNPAVCWAAARWTVLVFVAGIAMVWFFGGVDTSTLTAAT